MNGMNSMMYMYEAFKEEIQKVAEKVSQWNDEYTHCYLVADQWIRFNDGQGCSKAEWRAARDEMEYNLSPMAEAIDKPCMKTQVKQWQAAEDEFLATEIGIVESFLGNPFSTPDEDEAWDAIAAKQSRYQDKTGEDWIDEAARTFTAEEFRGAMRFSIGKYNRRMGKKDELIKEIEKMKDYCSRWLEVEVGR